MNKNYSNRNTINKSTLTQMYVYLVLFTIFDFYHEKFISTNCKNIFFYQKFVHLGENTSLYCSRIIVVHVHANVFLESSPSKSQYGKRYQNQTRAKHKLQPTNITRGKSTKTISNIAKYIRNSISNVVRLE